MGFGSYDESEQQDAQNEEEDTGETVDISRGDEGEVQYSSEAGADELLDQLQDIKGEQEQE